jgi:hypothetical protein
MEATDEREKAFGPSAFDLESSSKQIAEIDLEKQKQLAEKLSIFRGTVILEFRTKQINNFILLEVNKKEFAT